MKEYIMKTKLMYLGRTTYLLEIGNFRLLTDSNGNTLTVCRTLRQSALTIGMWTYSI